MPIESAGPTLSDFLENIELFRDALGSGAVAGATLGALGVYVLLRNLVFLSAALSQAAGLGVAASYWFGAASPALLGWLSPSLGAAALTLCAVLLFTLPRGPAQDHHHDAHQDGLLGVVFLVGAGGTLALGTRIVADIADIETLLFGSAVAVLAEDRATLIATGATLLGLHAWLWRGFAAVSVDADGARVRGLPVRALDLLLFASLALGVSVVTRILGALPAFAFSVLPAMAAVRIVRNLRQALVVAAALGATGATLGYLAAFLYELPVGASQTLVSAALLALAAGLERLGVQHRHRH
ncbi:MAG: hypothetical protein RIT45_1807 [Pseudomonadota bacterium]